MLGRAGQLQRHQEIGSGAHAWRQAVGDVEHGGAPGAGGQHDVVEAEIESVVDRKACRRSARRRTARIPARRCSSRRISLRKFLSQRTVMPYSATPPKPAMMRSSSDSNRDSDIMDRLEGHARARRHPRRTSATGSGSIFSPSMPTTLWPSFIRWCATVNPAGPMPGDQHAAAAGALRATAGVRSSGFQRVSRRVDLESPGQLQHVFQRARLRLRDVDRLLLLVDAGFHAVVADAVPGRRDHRVVDADHRQRADGDAFGLELLEFGNALFQRTAGERHAETVFLNGGRAAVSRGLLLQSVRARIAFLLVAPDAIVGLIERTDEIGAGIGERESVAPAHMRKRVHRDAVFCHGCRAAPDAENRVFSAP